MLEGWVTSGKKGNRVKQKQERYHQFITFCHARGKLNIDWQVIPTAANRIMMLIVSWRANRPVDVCLFFITLLSLTHQLCINRCSSFFLTLYVLTQSQEIHWSFKDVPESLTLFVPNIKDLHLCQPRDLNPGMKSLLTFQLS